MSSTNLLGCLLLGLTALACGGADGPKPLATGGSPGSGSPGSGGSPDSIGSGSGGTSGSGGATGLVNQVALSVQLSETACTDQTSWAWPDLADPVTATDRGTLGAGQGPDSVFYARCLVERKDDGTWDIQGFIDAADGGFVSVHAEVDPTGRAPADFQLYHSQLSFGVSSIQNSLTTLIEVSEGQAWGKVQCITTQEMDGDECGAAVVYFAFEDCYTTLREYVES